LARLIALVNNPMLVEKIATIATELDLEVIWSLELRGCVEAVTEIRPLVLLVDLHNEQTEWGAIVAALKTSPATRRVPIMGFAYPLDETLRKKAVAVFMDEIFDARDNAAKSDFLTTLAERLQAYARRLDANLQAALLAPCAQPMPELVKKGLEEFNAGEYYECHETLEAAWVAEPGPVRDVYRGILQVAVAYYQIQRGNYRGAMKVFLRSIQWLEPLPEKCQGIEIGRFREDARQARLALEALGPERIGEFDTGLFKLVIYDESQEQS
jgi:hypothetical protein